MDLNPAILNAIGGVTGVFGFVLVGIYLYSYLILKLAQISIRDTIGDESLFRADQVLKILAEFDDPESKLKALTTLANIERQKANQIIDVVKTNTSLETVRSKTADTARKTSLMFGSFLVLISSSALYLNYNNPLAATSLSRPLSAKSLPSNLPITPPLTAESCAFPPLEMIEFENGLRGIWTRKNDHFEATWNNPHQTAVITFENRGNGDIQFQRTDLNDTPNGDEYTAVYDGTFVTDRSTPSKCKLTGVVRWKSHGATSEGTWTSTW